MILKFVQLLQQVQRYIVPRQKQIVLIFIALEMGVVTLGLVVANLAISNPMASSWLLSEFGSKLGVTALLLFCATLVPGIVQRLRWHHPVLLPIVSLITLFRRHVGILMFLTAGTHMILNLYVPNFIFTGSAIPTALPPNYVLMGSIAWFLLLPVWLTSNDASQRFLGKKWKMLQRLTYLAVWFIFAHVALQGETLAIIVGIAAVLEVASWIAAKRR